MTQQPFSSASLRGAVDLSGLAGQRGGTPASASTPGPAAGGAAPGAADPSSGGVPGQRGALVHVTDATFESALNASARTAMVMVLWTPQIPESLQHLRDLAEAAKAREGRFQVLGVDLGANPAIMQAMTPLLQQAFGQVSALPVVLGWLGGQPVPFYLGAQPMEQVDQALDQFLDAAVANGIAGRVDVSGPIDASGEATPGAAGDGDGEGEEQDDLPPAHRKAYEAIDAGDWDGAVAAYESALRENPEDEMARLGLGQVSLLRRTSGLDLQAVRTAAAERPDDVQAQIEAADCDLVGGHVEDGFLRLIDTVRRTSGEDRDRARQHLVELFEVIGAQDERVVRARRSLMSALF